MSTIETSGALRPGTADTPLDQRTRVNSTADINNIELPYLGMLVYCIATGKYYKITKLKSKQLGALTVPDAAVGAYEEVDSIIFRSVREDPQMLTFLETLITEKFNELYTASTLTIAENRLAAFIDTDSVISDEDSISIEVWHDSTKLSADIIGFDGLELTQTINYQAIPYRIAIDLGSEYSGMVTVQYKKGDTFLAADIIALSSKPRYFSRPEGDGQWSLYINGVAASAEYYDGSTWIAFPEKGLPGELAGAPIRTVDVVHGQPAWWFNNDTGIAGIKFLYAI